MKNWRRRFARQGGHHFFLPVAGKAAAHAEVEEFEGIRAPAAPARRRGNSSILLRQAPPRFRQRGGLVEAAEIQLVDDVEHEDLEAHHVHHGAGGADAQVLAFGRHLDELALEAEQGEEVGEIALDEAQRAQVGHLVFREHQRAQVVQLALDLVLQFGQRIGRRVAAHEVIFAVWRGGMAVQQGLPHGELVEIGFKQAADDGHGALLR